ncbi:hypothetical protein HHI36_016924 [Cryptolaemus montrouzieri]|uniref:Uncharacterized protein n=1 Tax=Cryptolaemus montrouzieri TaxID=559131 RepID=A0ABD2NL61_9CUCU
MEIEATVSSAETDKATNRVMKKTTFSDVVKNSVVPTNLNSMTLNFDIDKYDSSVMKKAQFKTIKWLITGASKSTTIKVKQKKLFLFVSRINPDTTTEDFSEMVRINIPEAVCESLKSKHPTMYSLFKVTIDEASFERGEFRTSQGREYVARWSTYQKFFQKAILMRDPN